MKKWILATALFVCTGPCFALLSPLNQSLEEIKTIVTSHELQNYLAQDQPIKHIERTECGYLLKTDKTQLMVEIQYIPSSYPGRQQFRLNFQEPRQLKGAN